VIAASTQSTVRGSRSHGVVGTRVECGRSLTCLEIHLTRSRPAWLAVTVLSLSLGCAVVARFRRDASLRDELDAHLFARPLDAVWQEALKLLTERDYEVLGRDRAVVGLKEQTSLESFFQKGFETRDLGNGKRALETNPDKRMRRYRVEGTAIDADDCRVTFHLVQAYSQDISEDVDRDIFMEFALVERVEPEAAKHIETAAEKSAR